MVKLLAAGKSVVGVKDELSPYRVTHQRLLPKFGTERSPFTGRRPEPMADPVEAGSEVSAEAPREEPPKVAAPVSLMPVCPRRPSRSLAAKLAQLLFGPPPAPARLVLPQPGRPAVQGEFTLDQVKVVRNDLSDSDLEVIRPRETPATSAWGKATRRLLEPTQS